MMNNPRFIISGGGTGGHIFPALSIATELKRRHPACEILFVGAAGRMEMEDSALRGCPWPDSTAGTCSAISLCS